MPFEAEIVAMVAEERGVVPTKVNSESRLLEDLGMDGDDAVDFFRAFERRFSPDLEPLYRHWARHFGPEGWGWSDYRANLALWIGVALLVIGVAGFTPALTCPAGSLVIVGACFVGWRAQRKNRPQIPVTVGDLIAAAATKRWPLNYEAP